MVLNDKEKRSSHHFTSLGNTIIFNSHIDREFDIQYEFTMNGKPAHISIIKIYATLDRNIQRLLRLINTVHDLTKITHDLFDLSLSQTNLEEYVETVRFQNALLYPNNPITVDYISYTSKLTISIDSDRILQVLHNLISNAIKNSPPNNLVEIAFVRSVEELTITVRDYGVGIPLQAFFYLFQLFSHLDSPYSMVFNL